MKRLTKRRDTGLAVKLREELEAATSSQPTMSKNGRKIVSAKGLGGEPSIYRYVGVLHSARFSKHSGVNDRRLHPTRRPPF